MSLTGCVVLERQQELDRPLADIAGAPGGAGILLEAVRHREMHHRVVGEPREQRIECGEARDRFRAIRRPRVTFAQ